MPAGPVLNSIIYFYHFYPAKASSSMASSHANGLASSSFWESLLGNFSTMMHVSTTVVLSAKSNISGLALPS